MPIDDGLRQSLLFAQIDILHTLAHIAQLSAANMSTKWSIFGTILIELVSQTTSSSLATMLIFANLHRCIVRKRVRGDATLFALVILLFEWLPVSAASTVSLSTSLCKEYTLASATTHPL
ncbi:hypothetical protein C8Q80DRAFT_1267914 [Daedaleopsis nitida]|nr:hypothetical protein C8Q80DRAFT_1267914 [Daedaleopsis nitida]